MPVRALADLAPLLLGGLLGWTGVAKLTSRTLLRAASESALMQVLHDVTRVATALRALGAIEVALAIALLAAPQWPGPGLATAALGAGFLGYLGYARITAPDSSCGCAGSASAPITWRAFVRAGLVVAGGALVATSAGSAGSSDSAGGAGSSDTAGGAGSSDTAGPWWSAVLDRPLAAMGVLVGGLAVMAMLSTDLDHLWLLPLRRLRLRLLGHPLDGTSGPVPVAATVELLERSLAWGAAAPIVRSALIDHWDADGWRILHYAGVQDQRAVSVVFAVDARATVDNTANPAIRVTVVDEQTQEVIEHPSLVATA